MINFSLMIQLCHSALFLSSVHLQMRKQSTGKSSTAPRLQIPRQKSPSTHGVIILPTKLSISTKQEHINIKLHLKSHYFNTGIQTYWMHYILQTNFRYFASFKHRPAVLSKHKCDFVIFTLKLSNICTICPLHKIFYPVYLYFSLSLHLHLSLSLSFHKKWNEAMQSCLVK